MSITRASIQEMRAYLSDDFGLSYAMRVFGKTEDQLAELCGRYIKGKRKGKIRGLLIWEKCIRGGWKKNGPGYMNGHVMRPGTRLNYRLVIPQYGWGKEYKEILFAYGPDDKKQVEKGE